MRNIIFLVCAIFLLSGSASAEVYKNKDLTFKAMLYMQKEGNSVGCIIEIENHSNEPLKECRVISKFVSNDISAKLITTRSHNFGDITKPTMRLILPSELYVSGINFTTTYDNYWETDENKLRNWVHGFEDKTVEFPEKSTCKEYKCQYILEYNGQSIEVKK